MATHTGHALEPRGVVLYGKASDKARNARRQSRVAEQGIRAGPSLDDPSKELVLFYGG